MSVTIIEERMTSAATGFTACPFDPDRVFGPWVVWWLPGREMTRNQAITAMLLAEDVATWDGDTTSNTWQAIDANADQLGLTAAEAISQVCHQASRLGHDLGAGRPS